MKTIERVPHVSNYTVVSNAFVRDERLSGNAKGHFITILSFPDDFKVRVAYLRKLCSDGKGAIYSALRELEYYGYAEYVMERDPKTGQLSPYWRFSEHSKKPDVVGKRESRKKVKENQSQPVLFEEAALAFEDFSPLTENPETVIPQTASPPLLNTNKEILNNEVLKNQIQTSRESTAESPPKIEKANQVEKKVEPYPKEWMESFQRIYHDSHGGILGSSTIEENSLKTLFKMTNGSWEAVSEKIAILIEYRKGYEIFWRKQCVSPETILKFWSRLIRAEEVKYENQKEYPKYKKKEANFTKPKKTNEFHTNKNKEAKIQVVAKSAHESFLLWAKDLLPPASFAFYENNRDPSSYENSKRMVYNKYFAEVAPLEYRTAPGVNACDLKVNSFQPEVKTA
ncbi:hypothetical protein [Leptospira yasudae]|uniref:hypothetical protein n=1 Tax=Leptospira yasudae TaxID=2202201 RepID=UPI001090F8BE|nr:hypothetical protein [Leptospira yasudae]TGM99716.1 hypothetical protein EHR10_08990 [Leptospira yasudae]